MWNHTSSCLILLTICWHPLEESKKITRNYKTQADFLLVLCHLIHAFFYIYMKTSVATSPGKHFITALTKQIFLNWYFKKAASKSPTLLCLFPGLWNCVWNPLCCTVDQDGPLFLLTQLGSRWQHRCFFLFFLQIIRTRNPELKRRIRSWASYSIYSEAGGQYTKSSQTQAKTTSNGQIRKTNELKERDEHATGLPKPAYIYRKGKEGIRLRWNQRGQRCFMPVFLFHTHFEVLLPSWSQVCTSQIFISIR